MSISLISEPSIAIPLRYSCTIDVDKPFKSSWFGPEKEFESIKFIIHSNRVLRVQTASKKCGSIFEETFYLELVCRKVPQLDVHYKIKYHDLDSTSDPFLKLENGKPMKIGTFLIELHRNVVKCFDCQFTILYPYKYADKFADKKFATDLGALRKNAHFSDVTFVVGNKEFPAHRNILSVRSPVFETLFKQKNFVENQSNRIEFIDIESTVLEELLQFVYTGEVMNESVELAADLLVAAHMYQIDSLIKRCESNMTNSISIENASKYLTLADRYSLDKLKTKSLTFINANIKEVMQTEGWKVMIEDNLALMKDLYKNLALHNL